MAMFKMPQFMRQYRFNFTRIEARQQGIEKHDAFGFAKSSEIRIAMITPARAIHDKKAAGFWNRICSSVARFAS